MEIGSRIAFVGSPNFPVPLGRPAPRRLPPLVIVKNLPNFIVE
jgi:hypothetical protein